MAALTANLTTLKKVDRGATEPFVIKSSQTMYVNGLCGLDANGLLVPWDDTAITQRFVGVLEGFTRALYDGAVVSAGLTTLTPPHRGIVRVNGVRLDDVDVTGVSSRASIGEPVYCTTDNDDDFTLTPTSFVKPVGRLCDYESASSMSVRLFTPEEYAAYGSIGHWVFNLPLATLANGDIITTITPGFRGRFIKMYSTVTVAVSTGAKLATLNLEIHETNVTGGTLALTSANCDTLGKTVAAAAMTAAKAFTKAQTISLEAASVTTFAEGEVALVIQYQADE